MPLHRPLEILAACSLLGFSAASVPAAAPVGPQTQLLDTAQRSVDAWASAAIASRMGWATVEEDDLDHRFQGDVVLANGQLMVVLRWQAAGAEVYRRSTTGWNLRARLQPGDLGTSPASLNGIRTVENNPGAVMVDATVKNAAGKHATLSYRLAAGQIMLEIRGGAGAENLAIDCRPSWVLVPDFFGDDLVFGPATVPPGPPRIGVPTENFFLGLLDGGNAMLMCVWQSNKQQADMRLSGGQAQRYISGCEVQCLRDKTIWVALLEGPGLWHEQSVGPMPPGNQAPLGWKPPFAAKWRADLALADGWSASSYFRSSAEPRPADSTERACCPGPLPAECLLDGERALVRLPPSPADPSARYALPARPSSGKPPATARPLLVYPIDRTPATPLTAFCPIDVLRNTLGVGPCQYILQTEGLTSETNPTPESVAVWVEKQFSRKKEQQAAEEMRELLGQMIEHVGRAEARIGRYAELATELETLLGSRSVDAADLIRLREGTRRLAAITTASTVDRKPSQRAADAAVRIPTLIGRSNALTDCRLLTAELQAVGQFQDRALANCRMTVRWLREQVKATADPQATWAKQVQSRIEQVLQSK